MHDDLDIYNENDTEDEMYTSAHSRRTRRLRHQSVLDRRSALSLRPLRIKSYADSAMNYDSADSDAEQVVRKSTRKRNLRCRNMSWLQDDQMHKVGYPNLDTREYSEEEEEPNVNDNNRPSRREIKKNKKYLYEYETEENFSSRRRSRNSEEDNNGATRMLRPRIAADKENRPMNRRSGLRSAREDVEDNEEEDEIIRPPKQRQKVVSDKEEEENAQLDKNKVKKEEEEDEEEEEEEDTKNNEEKKESSESPEEDKQRTRQLRQRNYGQRRRTRNNKMLRESSSSENGRGRVYSLRDRVPKKVPTIIQIEQRGYNSRRYNRRRKTKPSSSSNSSDSDDRCRKKTPHSKNELLKSGAGGNKIIPIGPEHLDVNVKFSSVGGLDDHIRCLKEMVLLPMMYPEVFSKFQVKPPRGVLFYGPPGTGKTLIARALANECCFGAQKVSFFMRKGADLLSKWIGESEKQLRQLFEQAQEMKPSIIFFDELDGLAPVRSSRQDQVHASIVSTLLALMDGLDDRGEVIVIGATNRIDAIDPALRRPGRFDRELHFPLPGRKEREEILNVHMSKWNAKPKQELVAYLAEHAVGYCGSDLRALCSEAVIQSFRRTYPQVYNASFKLLLDPENVKIDKVDFLKAKSHLVPAAHRVAYSMGRKLLPVLHPLLAAPLKSLMDRLEKNFPHGTNPLLAK